MNKKGFSFQGRKFKIEDSNVYEKDRKAYSKDGETIYSDYYGELKSWRPSVDIKDMPRLDSGDLLLDALYKMALEEARLNVQGDGTFAAGEFWTGHVWTRDAAYSIILSLGLLMPQESINSLKAKLDKHRIIQDTGTGGSYPISTDRIIWVTAAWEVYKVTGDLEYLEEIYEIGKLNLETDLHIALDSRLGLFRGESSFMDWREQSYPYWFTWEKIYQSMSLSTNACFYNAFRILYKISRILDKPREESDFFREIRDRLKDRINQFLWMEDRGYYSSYRYPFPGNIQSDKSDALGEALNVLFGVAQGKRGEAVVANTPIVEYGVPCIFPQQPIGIPYHNKAVWPFVQAFFTWAGAKVKNIDAVNRGIALMIRQAALFLTNKENYVYDTGRPEGTALNSNRQLWSTAGFLAIIFRVLLGIELNEEGMLFNPFIPLGQFGDIKLSNLKHGRAVVNVRVIGQGSEVGSILVNGIGVKTDYVLPRNAEGVYHIDLYMKQGDINKGENLREGVRVSPKDPEWITLKQVDHGRIMLQWQPIRLCRYDIYKDGKYLASTNQSSYHVQLEEPHGEFHAYTVVAIDKDGILSNFSPWVMYSPWKEEYGAEDAILSSDLKVETSIWGCTGRGYVSNFYKNGDYIEFAVEAPCDDDYLIDFRYSNSKGGSDSNFCCIRSLYVNDKDAGTIVMGANSGDWWYSSNIAARLAKGVNRIRLQFDSRDQNMGGHNEAKIDHIRIIRLCSPV